MGVDVAFYSIALCEAQLVRILNFLGSEKAWDGIGSSVVAGLLTVYAGWLAFSATTKTNETMRMEVRRGIVTGYLVALDELSLKLMQMLKILNKIRDLPDATNKIFQETNVIAEHDFIKNTYEEIFRLNYQLPYEGCKVVVSLIRSQEFQNFLNKAWEEKSTPSGDDKIKFAVGVLGEGSPLLKAIDAVSHGVNRLDEIKSTYGQELDNIANYFRGKGLV